MTDFIEEPTPVTRNLIPEEQRLAVTADLFGAYFPLLIEPVIYEITERISKDYRGGFWRFWQLPNSGFYIASAGDQVYQMVCGNGYQGELSAYARGTVACLYAYSRLPFIDDTVFTSTQRWQLFCGPSTDDWPALGSSD